MDTTEQLERVRNGLLQEAGYRAEREAVEAELTIRKAFGKKGFSRTPGLMQRDLRLNDEAYGNALREGQAQALDKVKSLELSDYQSDKSLSWVAREREVDLGIEGIGDATKRVLIAVDVALERELADIRTDSERNADLIEIGYVRESKIIDMHGDAAARLEDLSNTLRTELAVAGLDLSVEKALQLINLDAITAAKTVELGYRRESQGITLDARMDGEISEAEASNAVEVQVAGARLDGTRLESSARLTAAINEGDAKIDRVQAISGTRNTVALQSGQVKLAVREAVNEVKLTQAGRENTAAITNLYRKNDAEILNSGARLMAKLDADSTVNTTKRQLLDDRLDTQFDILTDKIDTRLAAEASVLVAKRGARRRIIDARQAAQTLLLDAEQDKVTARSLLQGQISRDKVDTGLDLLDARGKARLVLTGNEILNGQLVTTTLNSADTNTAVKDAETSGTVMLINANSGLDKQRIVNAANIGKDLSVTSASLSAQRLKQTADNYAKSITSLTQESSSAIRLAGETGARAIGGASSANQRVDSAFTANSIELARARMDTHVAAINQSRTSTTYTYSEE